MSKWSKAKNLLDFNLINKNHNAQVKFILKTELHPYTYLR